MAFIGRHSSIRRLDLHRLGISLVLDTTTQDKIYHYEATHLITSMKGIFIWSSSSSPLSFILSPPSTNTHPSSANHQALTAVLVCILVAMVTFVLHGALCFLTRKWAYRAALQTMYGTSERHHLSPHSKRKRLRKRRPKLVQLPRYSSSSDCSL